MLVLHGSQGCGKTFTLNTIAKQWFIILNPKNAVGKDGLMLFHRGWIICNDELSTLSKYDIESLKSEITTTVDAIRLPYKADVQQMKRYLFSAAQLTTLNSLKTVRATGDS